MRGEMRERRTWSTDRIARQRRGAHKLVAVLSVVALTGLGLAATAPASATDAYQGPGFPVGNNPGGVAFTPDGSTAVVANDDPTLDLSNITTYNTATHAKLWSTTVDGVGANGVAISPDGTQAYVTYASDLSSAGGLTVVDLVNHTKLGAVTGTDPLYDVAFAPNGSKVYALDWPSGTGDAYYVAVVDPATRGLLSYIPVGEYPTSLTFSPDSSHAYVVNAGTNAATATMSVIDVATSTVTATVPLGGSPRESRSLPTDPPFLRRTMETEPTLALFP